MNQHRDGDGSRSVTARVHVLQHRNGWEEDSSSSPSSPSSLRTPAQIRAASTPATQTPTLPTSLPLPQVAASTAHMRFGKDGLLTRQGKKNTKVSPIASPPPPVQTQEDLQRREASLKELLKANPENSEVKYNLANHFKQQKNFTAAKRIYLEVLEGEPDNTKTLSNLANCHIVTGDLDEAKTLLRKVLTIDPDNVNALCNLGNLLKRAAAAAAGAAAAGAGAAAEIERCCEESSELLERALTLSAEQKEPAYFSSLCNLAEVKFTQGKKRAAVGYFTQAEATNPLHPWILKNKRIFVLLVT